MGWVHHCFHHINQLWHLDGWEKGLLRWSKEEIVVANINLCCCCSTAPQSDRPQGSWATIFHMRDVELSLFPSGLDLIFMGPLFMTRRLSLSQAPTIFPQFPLPSSLSQLASPKGANICYPLWLLLSAWTSALVSNVMWTRSLISRDGI